MSWYLQYQLAQQAKQQQQVQQQQQAQQPQSQQPTPQQTVVTNPNPPISPVPPDPSTSGQTVVVNGQIWRKVPTTPPTATPNNQSSQSDAFSLIKTVVTQPIETIGAFLNPISQIAAKDTSPLGTIVNAEIGAAGGLLNTGQQIKTTVYEAGNKIANIGKAPIANKQQTLVTPVGIPNPNQTRQIYTPTGTAQEVGKTSFEVAEAVIPAVILPIAAPEVLPISASNILKAGTVNAVINQGVNYAFTGKLDTSPQSIATSFLVGETFAVGSTATLRAISKIDPTITASRAGRTLVNVGVGGGAGYILSGADPAQTVTGAITGGAFSIGTELVYNPTSAAIRARLGISEPMVPGAPAIGKSGDLVPTYESREPIKALDNMKLRVIADVTENPVGQRGVTIQSMTNEYTGRQVPTAHATLNADAFSLKEGGETVLKGFPEQGAGYRASKELYHFYSAPGETGYVNVYGGYAGITEDTSSAFKLVMGGKPTILTTTGTRISEQFLPFEGETEAAYLARTSRLSGETGIAQETLLGKSLERQFVTPARYERFGENLTGSKYISEGKVRKFQIQELPQGRLGKIPVLRSMFSRYTDLTVYKGRYAPNDMFSGEKTLNVSKYNADYEGVTRVSSPVSFIGSPITPQIRSMKISPSGVSLVSKDSSPFSVNDKPSGASSNKGSSVSSVISDVSSFDYSLPSLPSDVSFSSVSGGSNPSQPNYSNPSLPSTSYSDIVSWIDTPSKPYPSIFSGGDTPSKPSPPGYSFGDTPSKPYPNEYHWDDTPSKPYSPKYPSGDTPLLNILPPSSSFKETKGRKRRSFWFEGIKSRKEVTPILTGMQVIRLDPSIPLKKRRK